MPYLVVNEAALKLLRDSLGAAIEDERLARTDWTEAKVALFTENQSITARICGALRDETAEKTADIETSAEGRDEESVHMGVEPEIYISCSSARKLLQRGGQPAQSSVIWADIRDAGAQEHVQMELEARGYTCENIDDGKLQEWALTQAKLEGELCAGGIGLIAFLVILAGRFREDGQRNRQIYQELQSVSTVKNVQIYLDACRTCLVVVGGALAAVLLWSLYII